MAVGQEVEFGDSLNGALHLTEIREDGRAPAPAKWRARVSWLADARSRQSFTWVLREDGAAWGLPDDRVREIVETLKQTESELSLSRFSMILFGGRWQADQTLVVPPPVAAHVLGEDRRIGPAYLWARGERLELLGLARHAEIRRAIASEFSDLAELY